MKFLAPLAVLATVVVAQDTMTTTSTITQTVTSTCTVKYATLSTSTTSSSSAPTLSTATVVPVGGYASTGTGVSPVGVYPTNVYNPSQVRPAPSSGGSQTNGTRPAPPIPTFTGAASSNGPQAIAAAIMGLAALFAVC
ncbi:hypothetical protein KVT40_003035 [Elsinoe batatas]|uniref:Uncharacterized protein n=1 Tax=Elsinoe batatas TaxID=2601811 RepID=A0A8K0L808_9PEZI|nr:hypothetical protein KVT40_003035 [Elsinoe batatas]